MKQTAALVIGGIATVVPFVSGLVVWLDPLRKSGQGGQAGFLPVARLDALPADGVPRKFTVLATKTDAWTKTPNVPVGAVYLTRMAPDRVVALHCICPHAGCFLEYREKRHDFFCPCHNSTFAVSGQINDPKSPSPRAMDALDVEIRGGEIWVRYQNFQAGHPDKRVVA